MSATQSPDAIVEWVAGAPDMWQAAVHSWLQLARHPNPGFASKSMLLHHITDVHESLVQSAGETFELAATMDDAHKLKLVQHLRHSGRDVLAAHMAIVLRMQHLLPLRELLDVWLPRNRHKDAENYVRGHPDLARELVHETYRSAGGKRAAATMKALGLGSEPEFMYIVRDREMAVLCWLIKSEQDAELLAAYVQPRPHLHHHACEMVLQNWGPEHSTSQWLITKLGRCRDFPSVAEYTDTVAPAWKAWPLQRICDAELGSTFRFAFRSDVDDARVTSLVLPPEVSVEWVSTSAQAMHALEWLATQAEVGLDCEWTPLPDPVTGEAMTRVAVLQLGTMDRVVLLDTLAMADWAEPEAHACMQALRDVLQRAHIVGLGVDKDLHIVRKSIPHGHLLGEPRVIVELGSFGRALADQAAKPSPKPPRSLSDLCELVLGKPMDKQARMTDWEMRPLSDPQLHYAALDAHAAVALLLKLREMGIASPPHAPAPLDQEQEAVPSM